MVRKLTSICEAVPICCFHVQRDLLWRALSREQVWIDVVLLLEFQHVWVLSEHDVFAQHVGENEFAFKSSLVEGKNAKIVLVCIFK